MAKEVKEKDVASVQAEDLIVELAELKQEYRRMQLDHALRGLTNPLALRGVRRDIARINTEIRRREVSEMSLEDIAGRSRLRARRRRLRRK
jgi:large subunit ribosomal protein L29